MNPRPVLIIADSLLGIIKAIHGRGSIAVQEYQIVDRFKCMSDRFSIPILVIHHSRKLKGDAIESAMVRLSRRLTQTVKTLVSVQ